MGPSEGGFHAPKVEGAQLKFWNLYVDQGIYLYPIIHLLPHFTLKIWDRYVMFDLLEKNGALGFESDSLRLMHGFLLREGFPRELNVVQF